MVLIMLYLTELFRFALFLSLSLNIFAMVAVVYLSFYCLMHSALFSGPLVISKNMLWSVLIFFFMLGIAPLHSLLGFMSLEDMIRPLGNSLLFMLLFFSAYIIGLKYDMAFLKKYLIYPSLVIIIGGLVYNYINPNLFYKLKLLLNDINEGGDKDLSQVERTAGFYLKSTYAAFSMVPVLFFLFLSSKSRRLIWSLLITVLIVALVFLTGSRSVLLFLVPSFIFIGKGLYNSLNKKYMMSKNSSAELMLIGMPIILVFAFVSLFYFSLYLSDQGFKVLGDRVVSLTSASDLAADNSVNERLEAQKLYIGKILQNPLIGYGPLYGDELRKNNEFKSNSHNSYIEYTFRYGLFYIFIFFYFVYRLWISPERKLLNRYYNFDYLGLFAIYLLICSLFNNTMMENKTIVIMLGLSTALGKRLIDKQVVLK